jgi:hypothetical protein
VPYDHCRYDYDMPSYTAVLKEYSAIEDDAQRTEFLSTRQAQVSKMFEHARQLISWALRVDDERRDQIHDIRIAHSAK